MKLYRDLMDSAVFPDRTRCSHARKGCAHRTCARISTMKNLTLSIEEQLLIQSREHARRLGKSLNQFVRDLLTQSVRGDSDPFEEMIELADKMQLCSEQGPLTREEAHERG